MARPIVVDVDTGTDDALALLYAVGSADLDLRAVTCVAGNAGLQQVVDNTLRVLEAAGAGPVPVAAGATKPLIERMRPEGQFHGEDGLAGVVLAWRLGGVRRSVHVPIALFGAGVLTFVATGVAGLSVLPRYLTAPVVAVCIVAGYGVLGFTTLAPGRLRRWWRPVRR